MLKKRWEKKLRIKSIYDNQDDILNAILNLHCNGFIDADLTYGNGSFYKNIKKPIWCFDIDPQTTDTIKSCSTNTPLSSNSVKSVMFDPPFLTYIKNGRENTSIMGKRFSGYYRYDELENHYKKTLIEAKRILEKKGIFIIKCQDIIHNHKMHSTHINVFNWASEIGFRLKDLFILQAKHRLPSPNKNGIQKHARIYHSYFMVFES